MSQVLLGIALNSWKQLVRDRIFYVVLLMACLMLGFSYVLATLTIVESRKILLDFGFSAVSLASGLSAVYVGITAVAREIEQRTIYSIVTKPLSRSTYLLGKFLGSVLVVGAVHVLLSLNLLAILLLNREEAPVGFSACLFLVFLETVVLLGFAFLCSSFSGSIMAAGLTLSFFLIGRSHSSFELLSERALTPGARYVAKALYFSMPNLERFNVRDLVAYGKPYPEEMLWVGIAYTAACLLFCLGASCLILRSRDLP